MFFKNFFSRSDQCVPYKMFSVTHLFLVIFAFLVIAFLLYKSKECNKSRVKSIIKRCTVIMWCMEIVKISFNLLQGNGGDLNTYVPLYYCSLPLYCGFGSVYGKGHIKRLCDVFMLFGGITGGIIYIIFPATTSGIYPAIHMITLQSFVHHSIMAYLGILMIKTDYVEIKVNDIKYYSIMIIATSVLAYGVNAIFGSNLMFVSSYHPESATEILYNLCPSLYTVLIVLIQAFPPYFLVYVCAKLYKKCKKKSLAK